VFILYEPTEHEPIPMASIGERERERKEKQRII